MEWEKLSVEKQDDIAEDFYKERDLYAYHIDGTLTTEFKRYLDEEGFKNE